jgi:uncharacterized protein (UPF0333 family)
MMDNRGQTTFEYLLLVGGVVILAVLVIWMLTSGVQGSATDVNESIVSATKTFSREVNDILSKI